MISIVIGRLAKRPVQWAFETIPYTKREIKGPALYRKHAGGLGYASDCERGTSIRKIERVRRRRGAGLIRKQGDEGTNTEIRLVKTDLGGGKAAKRNTTVGTSERYKEVVRGLCPTTRNWKEDVNKKPKTGKQGIPELRRESGKIESVGAEKNKPSISRRKGELGLDNSGTAAADRFARRRTGTGVRGTTHPHN